MMMTPVMMMTMLSGGQQVWVGGSQWARARFASTIHGHRYSSCLSPKYDDDDYDAARAVICPIMGPPNPSQVPRPTLRRLSSQSGNLTTQDKTRQDIFRAYIGHCLQNRMEYIWHIPLEQHSFFQAVFLPHHFLGHISGHILYIQYRFSCVNIWVWLAEIFVWLFNFTVTIQEWDQNQQQTRSQVNEYNICI